MKTRSEVVIAAILTIFLICSVSNTSLIFSLPPDPNYGKRGECFILEGDKDMRCCWEEPDILNPGETIKWCQTCAHVFPPSNCGPVFSENPSPKGPISHSEDGVLEQPEEPSSNDDNDFPNDGVVEEPKSPLQGDSPNTPFNRGGILKE